MQKTGKTTFILSVCALAFSLGGCGGGGSGTPPPTIPPPPPPPANLDDAEYRNSNGAVFSSALAAYQGNDTGDGVTIAIVDSGINPDLPDFIGRIDFASLDIIGNRGVTDPNGHGTKVAAIAAAGRNGYYMQGVAYDATILSLNSSDPNNCDLRECYHPYPAIAIAVDFARWNGARIINISITGSATDPSLVDALRRATDAGIIVVVSAGDDGAVDPAPFALLNSGGGTSGLFIIAGAVDANRVITGNSNRAGAGAQYYLTALGQRVTTIDQYGNPSHLNGTSAATPVISGAAALLAGAFPNLTGAQIVDLLLTTADDAGAPGTDAIYGRGILNIGRAFQPQGITTLAGLAAPVSLMDNGISSAPMGDAAFGADGKGAIILDGYSRAYALNLAQTLSRAAQEQPLRQAIGNGAYRSTSTSAGPVSVSISFRQDLAGGPGIGIEQMSLGFEDSRKAQVMAGTAIGHLTPKTALAFGFSESGRALQQQLANQQNGAFMVARDPMARTGFQSDAGASLGFRHDFGPVAMTTTSERGEIYNPGLQRTLGRPRYTISSFMLDRKIGPVRLGIGASRLEEESTVLGGRFSSAFSSGGSSTSFVDGTASFSLGGGWSTFASYRQGWTSMSGTGALVDKARLVTNAFAFDLAKTGAFSHNDRIAFRVMQPLRVTNGGFDMNMPVSYDYATKSTGYEQRFFNLAPTGREIDYEIAYSIAMPGGYWGVNAYMRTDPGHIETMKKDIGAVIRFTLGK